MYSAALLEINFLKFGFLNYLAKFSTLSKVIVINNNKIKTSKY